MSSDSTESNESSGVQQLIDRLHQQGVARGQAESDTLLAAAREQAADILDRAERDAERVSQAGCPDRVGCSEGVVGRDRSVGVVAQQELTAEDAPEPRVVVVDEVDLPRIVGAHLPS